MTGNKYTSKVTCEFCQSEMELDDIDENFKGNQDNYYLCPCCQSSAVEKIRYGKRCGKINYEKYEDCQIDDLTELDNVSESMLAD